MSTNAISSALASALENVHGHGRHKSSRGASVSSAASGTSSIGQLPVGVSTSLFSNLVSSFQQGLASQSSSTVAAAQAAGATGTSGSSATGTSGTAQLTPAQQQEAQAFMHSLFQALKQDGLSAGASGAPVSPSTAANSSSGNYQGSLGTSLQALIQQLGADGKSTAATQTLTSTFQNLVSGVTGAAAGSSSSDSTNASLRNFLGNLLQNVQGNGVQSIGLAGASVNTHV
jgi:hypothetical protein